MRRLTAPASPKISVSQQSSSLFLILAAVGTGDRVLFSRVGTHLRSESPPSRWWVGGGRAQSAGQNSRPGHADASEFTVPVKVTSMKGEGMNSSPIPSSPQIDLALEVTVIFYTESSESVH